MSVLLAAASVLWAVIGWVLAGLLGVLLTLVVFPFQLRAEGAVSDDALVGTARLSWLLGLIGVEISVDQGAALTLLGARVWRLPPGSSLKKGAVRRRKKKDRTGQKPGRSHLDRVRALFAHRGHLWTFVKQVLATAALRGRAGGVIGTGDPVETVSLRTAAMALEARVEALELELEFDYIEDIIDVWAEIRGRIWVAHMLWILLVFACKRDTWRLVRQVRA